MNFFLIVQIHSFRKLLAHKLKLFWDIGTKIENGYIQKLKLTWDKKL